MESSRMPPPGEAGAARPALKVARRAEIAPFIVMDVMRAANAYAARAAAENRPGIIHLEVGQPSSPAPLKVREAAMAALQRDLIGYSDSLGLPALRRRIAQHYGEFYDLAVPGERIAVTTGSSGGFLLAFLPPSILATGWRWPARAIPATATSSPPSASSR